MIIIEQAQKQNESQQWTIFHSAVCVLDLTSDSVFETVYFLFFLTFSWFEVFVLTFATLCHLAENSIADVIFSTIVRLQLLTFL